MGLFDTLKIWSPETVKTIPEGTFVHIQWMNICYCVYENTIIHTISCMYFNLLFYMHLPIRLSKEKMWVGTGEERPMLIHRSPIVNDE